MDQLSTETTVIVSFALCGFANIGSLGIVLGGIGGMVPDKRGQIAKLAVRALIAAGLANLLNAAVAGLFIF